MGSVYSSQGSGDGLLLWRRNVMISQQGAGEVAGTVA